MKIIAKHVLRGRVWANVQGETDDYWVYISSKQYDFESFCTCLSFHFNKTKFCKHCKFILYSLNNNEVEIFNMDVELDYVESSLKGINDMQGGWPTGTLQGIVGPSRIGKSHLINQDEIFMLSKNPKINGLNIVTESKDDQFQIKPWLKIYNKRFDCDIGLEQWTLDEEEYFEKAEYKTNPKRGSPQTKYKFNIPIPYKKIETDKEQKIITVRCKSLFSVLLLIGMPSLVKISEGGKILIKPNPYWELQFIWRTPLAKIVKDNNIGVLVLDSLSTPIKNLYIAGEQEMFPERAKGQTQILSRFDYLAEKHNIPCFMIHHATINEASMFKHYKAYGGAMIEYTHKFELMMKGGKKAFITNTRIPDVAPLSRKAHIKIGDNGMFDTKAPIIRKKE